jgi:2,5-diketo-D-gluconate reductase A
VTPERIEENLAIFDFELSDDEMEAIEALDAGERIGADPDTFVRP